MLERLDGETMSTVVTFSIMRVDCTVNFTVIIFIPYNIKLSELIEEYIHIMF